MVLAGDASITSSTTMTAYSTSISSTVSVSAGESNFSSLGIVVMEPVLWTKSEVIPNF